MRYFIRVNGARFNLDVEAANEGNFHREPDTLDEQCEDCGESITETGDLYGDPRDENGAGVECSELSGGCGAFYVVEVEEDRSSERASYSDIARDGMTE
jgi:hypothetical protein